MPIQRIRILVLLASLAAAFPCPAQEAPESPPAGEDAAIAPQRLAERERRWHEAQSLHAEGKLAEAIAIGEKLLRLEEELFGNVHAELTRTLEWLAGRYFQSQRWEQAKAAAARNRAICQEVFGIEAWQTVSSRWRVDWIDRAAAAPPDVSARLHSLEADAIRLRKEEAWLAAVERQQEIAELEKQVLGDPHPFLANTYISMADSLIHARELDKAATVAERGESMRMQCLGTDHPDTAHAIFQVGRVRLAQNRYNDAKAKFAQAAESYKAAGNEIFAAWMDCWQGDCYRGLGDDDKAAEAYGRSVARFEEQSHSDGVAVNANRLAQVFKRQNKHEEAADAYGKAAASYAKIEQHESAASNAFEQGKLLRDLKRFEAAVKAFQQAAESYKAAGNEKEVVMMLWWQGSCYLDSGNEEQAIRRYREAISRSFALGGPYSSFYQVVRIGAAYANLGKHEEAAVIYSQCAEAAFQSSQLRLAEWSSEIAGAEYTWLRLHREAADAYGKAADAATRLANSRGGKQSFGGEYAFNQGWHLMQLKAYHEAMGALARAEMYFRDSNSEAKATEMLVWLGDCYRETGQHGKAIESYSQSLAGFEELGDTEGLIVSVNRLAALYRELGKPEDVAAVYQRLRRILHETAGQSVSLPTLDRCVDLRQLGTDPIPSLQAYSESLRQAAQTRDNTTLARIASETRDIAEQFVVFEKYEPAVAACEISIAAYEAARDLRNATVMRELLGHCHERLRNMDKAEEAYLEAVSRWEELPDEPSIFQAMGQLGMMYSRQGRHAAAEPLLHVVLGSSSRPSSDPQRTPMWFALAVSRFGLGNTAEGKTAVIKWLEQGESTELPQREIVDLRSLAQVRIQEKAFREARIYLDIVRESLQLAWQGQRLADDFILNEAKELILALGRLGRKDLPLGRYYDESIAEIIVDACMKLPVAYQRDPLLLQELGLAFATTSHRMRECKESQTSPIPAQQDYEFKALNFQYHAVRMLEELANQNPSQAIESRLVESYEVLVETLLNSKKEADLWYVFSKLDVTRFRDSRDVERAKARLDRYFKLLDTVLRDERKNEEVILEAKLTLLENLIKTACDLELQEVQAEFLLQAIRLCERRGRYRRAASFWTRLPSIGTSETAYRDAIRECENTSNDERLGWILGALGRRYSSQGNVKKAESVLRRSLVLFEKVGESGRVPLALHQRWLSWVLDEDFGTFPPSLFLLRDPDEIMPVRAAPNWSSAQPLGVYAIGRRIQTSEIRRSYPKVLPVDFFWRPEDMLRMARQSISGHPNRVDLLSIAGVGLEERQDSTEARKLIAESVQEASHSLEARLIGLSEQQQIEAVHRFRQVLDRYLWFALRHPEAAGDAYSAMLNWKGFTLVRQRRIRELAADAKLASGFRELEIVANRLAVLSRVSPQDCRERELQQAKLAQLSRYRDDVIGDLQQKSVQLDEALKPICREEVLRALPRNTVLVDYLETLPDFEHTRIAFGSTPTLLAFVVRRDEPVQLVDLGPVAPIRQAIDQWRDAVTRRAPETLVAGVTLRSLIWEPLLPSIENAETVLVSSDGDLGRLPFGALPGRETGTYLLEDHRLAYLPVPQLLPTLLSRGERKSATKALLLVGGVDYDALPEDSVLAAEKPAWELDRAPRGELTFPYLSGTLREVGGIQLSFQQTYRVQPGLIELLTGTSATKRRFRELAPQCAMVHVATHGFFADPQYPSAFSEGALRAAAGERLGQNQSDERDGQVQGFSPYLLSGLAFAGANQPPRADIDDGILTAEEIAHLPLERTDMVVLSACETGLGQVAGGEGLLGLQRAFQISGARTTVASLWRVHDAITEKLMHRFYSNLWEKKMSRLDALREAQLYLLKHPDEVRGADPEDAPEEEERELALKYWAAFTLSGDWR
jgi:CHAT domain-containing protein